ncbi:Phosphoglycolate phosphatase [Gluconacetobacter sp. SXCC-1]|uniref:phosphoglycolate phosphatase n=1 Tax=Komagataeibacter rhaeticus TaxID=215221 RepID=A0A858JHR6_9PROT|nr:HAD hydrolase-like protein [Komagataeibacter rhaeticus]ATU72223.1 phosphoglycolate phosphatase [Komagataeibacter xylinus]EGG75251.1 Phosphoglycolate phosphatase [Gluconacetobacter sp. SXCC-1]QIP34942.1 HAD hydrolase-like protein [Komagataeibacter rhaeticus]QOC47479.1 HAD hydrolase-like protein [Komagataeibacter rhaeticus]WPP21947.1 HAD hydrolase-like protein [Komagataeibacter rhaeticus]
MMTSSLPRLAVFDMDGTLIDSLPDLAACASRLLVHYGLSPITPDLVRPMVGDGVAMLVRRLLAHAGPAATGIDPTEATTRYMADYTPHSTDLSRPFPGTETMLARLRADGWHMAVCTNKPVAAARHILKGLGLEDWFIAVGGGDSFAARKPDPCPLLGTIELAGGDPRRAIMTGDHHNDVACALGAHVPAIFARWGYGQPDMEAGATVGADSIAEIARLAGELIPA